MALHPKLPYAVLLPERRWFPAAEELRATAYEKLLPLLVAKIRTESAYSAPYEVQNSAMIRASLKQ